MKLNSLIKLIFCLIIAFNIDISSINAQEGYPEPENEYLNDYAFALSQTESEKIYNKFRELRGRTQSEIEMTAVIIYSIKDYNTGDTTIESFATNLFNTWGIGKKATNNGVLILVAVKDRKVRIELGSGYSKYYDSKMKFIIDNTMVPLFKTKQYGEGILQGSTDIINAITKEVSWFAFYFWHIILVILLIVSIFAGISCFKKGWGWAFFAAAGVLLFFLIQLLFIADGFGGGGASGSW